MLKAVMLFKSFKKQQKGVRGQHKWISIFLSSWEIKDINYLGFCSASKDHSSVTLTQRLVTLEYLFEVNINFL